jgi:hypothetical protein
VITEYDSGTVESTRGNVKISGRIAYNRFEEYKGFRQQIVESITDDSLIDITRLEFLSSSGIAMVAMICVDLKKMGSKPVKIRINKDLEWQSRFISNLKRMWAGITQE